MARAYNFYAGPAVLPEEVIKSLQDAIWDYGHAGVGIMECSHRTDVFQEIMDTAQRRLRMLLNLDDDQEILFLQGGAQSQFFMLPMNVLRGGRAAYLDTGVWSQKAIAEAKRYGDADVLFSGAESGYTQLPEQGAWEASLSDHAYLHYTSNNTIYGTQFHTIPHVENTTLVCDASSDILCRPIDGSKYDVLYAGAQKNLGPSGVTIVIIRRSLLERCDPELPTMLRYGVHVKKQSMYNTPNTLGVFTVGLMARWVEKSGGAQGMFVRNKSQADRVYAVLDGSDYWQTPVGKSSRSMMNIVFSTGDADLDTRFWKEAAQEGLVGLKGHRLVGGLRASLYNAQSKSAVDALVDFIEDFEEMNG